MGRFKDEKITLQDIKGVLTGLTIDDLAWKAGVKARKAEIMANKLKTDK